MFSTEVCSVSLINRLCIEIMILSPPATKTRTLLEIGINILEFDYITEDLL